MVPLENKQKVSSVPTHFLLLFEVILMFSWLIANKTFLILFHKDNLLIYSVIQVDIGGHPPFPIGSK
jgi:hypothetical protein